ncbi:MAG: hypothetical protein KJN64_03185 [Ignavibacteria bacterium]|nr:hypothetical protein [Ignavibacteria bacterium]MBT8381244.1 hypothetical protein [Ignavibacteria bacterium]MBT8391266.1 hypothetical protein [Ignavibacteria bacterium]NNJ54375.1 hypothetical protein [Ignavibacteriaceae bacterium]NNL21687.1 hypothetical protein [Ignavibacteriaceae bacterium]
MGTLKPKVSKEQLLYANILNAGMLVGLAGLLVTFVLYATGILKPFIPLEKIPQYWVLSVHEYLEESRISAGWAWFGNLEFGDMLNFLPIAFLSLLTIVCYLSILPELAKNKDRAYMVICILEVLVLLVAASGILGTGGH